MEAYALGFDNPLAFSAEHGEGLVDLFDALRPIVEPFMEAGETEAPGDEEEPPGPLKLANVGRPTAGQSKPIKIGSASCRARVCPYVWISVVAVTFKKKKKKT